MVQMVGRTGWRVDWLGNWREDWLAGWLEKRLASWLEGGLPDWMGWTLVFLLEDELIGWLKEWLAAWVAEGRIGWIVKWLTGLLAVYWSHTDNHTMKCEVVKRRNLLWVKWRGKWFLPRKLKNTWLPCVDGGQHALLNCFYECQYMCFYFSAWV